MTQRASGKNGFVSQNGLFRGLRKMAFLSNFGHRCRFEDIAERVSAPTGAGRGPRGGVSQNDSSAPGEAMDDRSALRRLLPPYPHGLPRRRTASDPQERQGAGAGQHSTVAAVQTPSPRPPLPNPPPPGARAFCTQQKKASFHAEHGSGEPTVSDSVAGGPARLRWWRDQGPAAAARDRGPLAAARDRGPLAAVRARSA